jgi:hypothetical protein
MTWADKAPYVLLALSSAVNLWLQLKVNREEYKSQSIQYELEKMTNRWHDSEARTEKLSEEIQAMYPPK